MIRAFRPIFALFARSIRDEVRSKFPPILRALAVAFVLLLVWGNQREFDAAAPGRTLLMMLALVNLASATILGLGTFSSAITEEKEEETIGLLLMTRLNPLAILLGKSTARLAGGLLFVIAQIPFTMLCVTLGGVTMEQVLHVYAILGAYLALLCNLCLLWSVLCRRTNLAVVASFAILVVLYVGAPLLLSMAGTSAMFGGPGAGPGGMVSALIHLIGANPFVDTARVIFPNSGFPFATHSIGFNLTAAAALFLVSWALFGRFCTGGGEAVPRRRPAAGSGSRPSRSRAWVRALAWKDFHFFAGGGRGIFFRTGIYLLLCGGIIWLMHRQFYKPGEREYGQIIGWCGKFIFFAELGSASARIFGLERKRQTLGSLVALPITMGCLIRQKVLGYLPALLPSLGLCFLGVAMQWDWESTHGYRYGRGREAGIESAFYVLLCAETALFAVLVAYLSLRMRRAPLLTGIGILLFANILAGVLGELLGFNREAEVQAGVYLLIGVTSFLTIFLANAIPGRLAHCAAEE